MNETFRKFGWPTTKIAELDHWGVMLRPEQPTLGSLVLACKQPAKAFSDVDASGYAELKHAVHGIETMLTGVVAYQMINYLMLMMVDPDVHFHVVPRYDGCRTLGDLSITDVGWPGPPALGSATALSAVEIQLIVGLLSSRWQR